MNSFSRSPGFAATAVLTLAGGIGAIVAMFSVYSRVVLNPVTVPDPPTLLSIYAVNHKVKFVPPTLSWPRFEAIRRGTTVFSHLGAYSTESINLGGADGPPEQLRGLRVSGDFFAALRTVPASGRLFAPEDDLPHGPSVCILSYEFWQSRFGGRDVVGTNIQLDGRPSQVVGILPPRLSPPWSDRQIFIPRVFEDSGLSPQAIANTATYLQVVGRLRAGATPARAGDEIHAVSHDYAVRFAGRSDAASETEIRSLVETVTGGRRAVFTLLLGAVAVVLLVSCANTSALVLSRLVSRQREIAVRQALGASRGRIVRQLLAESLILSSVAGTIGVLAAYGILAVTQATLAAEFPAGVVLRLDGTALLVAVGVVLACGLLVGLLPALHVTRPSKSSPLTGFMRGMSEGVTTQRFRASLVIVEVGLSVFLLVGATLLLGSLSRLQRTSPGFDPSGVAAALTSLPPERYPTPERQSVFFADVLEQLRRNPQVTGAAIVFGLPFHDDNYASTYAVAGRPILAPADRARAGLRIVTENYFKVMRIRLLEGRGFNSTDRAGAPGVCIVNESLARRQFGGLSALGQVIRRGREAEQYYEIVGVVGDVKTNGLRADTPDEIFFSFRQLPRGTAAIVARTNGNPAMLERVFQSAVTAVDPDQPISRFASMDRRLVGTLGPDRVAAGITTVFAAIALLLASVGLYAVLAHSVTARTVEIGIRMAIGAERSAIVRLIVSQGMRLVGAGIATGLVAAGAASRILAAQLYGVSPRDPWVYALVAGIFAAVGAAASLAPALRASRVDPLTSLNAR